LILDDYQNGIIYFSFFSFFTSFYKMQNLLRFRNDIVWQLNESDNLGGGDTSAKTDSYRELCFPSDKKHDERISR
jgi:hypothetical protein